MQRLMTKNPDFDCTYCAVLQTVHDPSCILDNTSDIDLGGKKGGGATYTEFGDDSPFVTYEQVGYGGGDAFSYYGGEDGSMLKRIGVYYQNKGYRGIKIWRTNGDSESYGTPKGTYREYTFENGEVMTKLSLWYGKKKKWFCGIKFETNTGGSFDALCKKEKKQEFPIDIGSGIPVGLQGRSGSSIDALGFVFVKKLASSKMSNVDYPDIGITDANVHVQSLKQVTYTNTLDTEQTFTFTDTVTKTTSEKWEISNTLTNSFELTVSATVPILEVATLTVTETYKLETSSTHTHSSEEKTETIEEWTYPVTVPAQSAVEVELEIGRADISLSYTATVTMTTVDGSELTFDISGDYEGVTYTNIAMDISEVESLT